MKKVITISRQYASGGRTIGKMAAQPPGIEKCVELIVNAGK